MIYPVPATDLRTISFTHFDFAGVERTGNFVIHQIIESAVVEILDLAYQIRFPIHKAILIDDPAYCGNDELSMLDNNSSCFNDRKISGTSKISMHALGLAVDINPELNPYLASNGIWYPNDSHTNRSIIRSGMFNADHPIVQAFVERGFEWGGSWKQPDYHHFEWLTVVQTA